MADKKRIADDYEYINARMREIQDDKQTAREMADLSSGEKQDECQFCGNYRFLQTWKSRNSKTYIICDMCIRKHKCT